VSDDLVGATGAQHLRSRHDPVLAERQESKGSLVHVCSPSFDDLRGRPGQGATKALARGEVRPMWLGWRRTRSIAGSSDG
jgi:hypothetical protein